MKAVLVIDMPNNCEECNIIYLQGHGENICDSGDWSKRPSWCPLKPLPQKKEVKVNEIDDIMHTEFQTMDAITNKFIADIKFETDKLIALGYNACLDEIMGETE